MRTFYDSVTASNIPTGADGVCGYIDGLYCWSDADWALFPNSVKVRIAISASTNDGHVLDCEWGDATPAECPPWVVKRRAAGTDPTVYCTTSNWQAVKDAFAAAGVAEPHYWVAAYPGDGATIPAGAVAHQWKGGMTAAVDESAVADYWPGVDVPSTAITATTTSPALTEEDLMPWFIRCKTGAIVIVGVGGVRALTPAAWQVWKNLGFGDIPPQYAAMDPGPFASVIADLGGLVK